MKYLHAITLSILVAVPLAAPAADAEPPVVVTATRDARAANRVPANVTIVTAADIVEGNYASLVDVLDDVVGITLRSTSGNASQSEVAMRGFGENAHGRVLVLLDGRRLNRPDMAGINWLQVPISNVERIEIVRGSSSATYGDYAVAGVINIVTRKGTKDKTVTASLDIGSFSTDVEQVALTGSRGKLTYAVTAGHEETDGYRERSAYASWGAGLNLGCDFTERVSCSLALSFNTIDYEMPSGLTKEEWEADPTQSTDPDPLDTAENNYANADAGLNVAINDNSRVSINVMFGRKDMQSDNTGQYFSSFFDLAIDTVACTPRYVLDRPLLGRDNRLTAGMDYYVDDLSLKRYGSTSRTDRNASVDVEKTTTGFYLLDELDLTGSLILGLGLRSETADISATMSDPSNTVFDDSKRHDKQTFDVSITRLCGENSKVFARFGTVYRYPFVDEQAVYSGYGSDQLYANIESENGTSCEVGAALRPTDRLAVSLSAFLLDMEDEIAYNNETWRNENLDKTRHAGVELEASCALTDTLSLNAGYTFTEAEFTDGPNDGSDIPLTPDQTVSLTAVLSLPRGLSLRAGGRYMDSVYLGGDYGNTGDRIPDYIVADVSLRYAPHKNGGLAAHIAVDNVLDEDYATAGYWGQYYPAAGRSVRAGISCRF